MKKPNKIFSHLTSPTAYMVYAGVSVVATIVATVFATKKTTDILAEEHETTAEKVEAVKDVAVACAPVAVAATASMFFMVKSNRKAIFLLKNLNQLYELSEHRRHDLMDVAGGALLSEAMKRKQPEENDILEYEEQNHLFWFGFNDKETANYGPTITFYDDISDRYFESTMVDVVLAEYHLNRNYYLGAEVDCNMWFDFLGLEPLDKFDGIGWNAMTNMEGIYNIDFTHQRIDYPDGSFIYAIYPVFAPCVMDEELYDAYLCGCGDQFSRR